MEWILSGNSHVSESLPTSLMSALPEASKWVNSLQRWAGEKPGNYRLHGYYSRAWNCSVISPSSLLVNNQIPSFQCTQPSPFPTGVGEAGSGQGNWVLPGAFGIEWTLLDLISHGSRDVPRLSPLGGRAGWFSKRAVNRRQFMKTGNGIGGHIRGGILQRACGMGINTGLGARISCLNACLNLPGDWGELPCHLGFHFFIRIEGIGWADL